MAAQVPRAVEAVGRQALLARLDPGKRDRILRLAQQEDRDRSAVAHVLAQLAIGRRLGNGPAPAEVAADRCGKPYLPAAPWLHLSLAHAGEWAVCATGSTPLGVDVESLRAMGEGTPLHILSPREAGKLSACASTERQRRVCELWTVKESFVKALGIGWDIPPDSMTVEILKDGGVAVESPLASERYRFGRYALDEDYLVALCARKGSFPDAVERVDPAVLREFVAAVPAV
jgi:4'-phosphopantetheinyl transferase